MNLRVDVLECKSGVSKSKRPYNIVLVRDKLSGVVGKIFSDRALEVEEDVSVNVKLVSNQEMFLTPRIVEGE